MSDQNAQLIRDGYEAFAQGDIPTVLGLFDKDIDWHVPGRSPLSGDYHGHDGVRHSWRAWLEAWESIDAPLERLVDAGAQVVALLGQSTYRGKRSGVEVDLRPWAQV